jgi:phage/plasmid-like protein (TIGR03299 family)
MAHEITQRADGVFEFAFNAAHGAGWHGLGQPVSTEHVHDVAHWQQAAGMDWRIQRSKVRFSVSRDDADGAQVWDDQHVLFRSDTKAPLGIVSDGYKAVQPREVVEFFRGLVEAGGLELSAMGTLQGGRRFWATARIGEAAPLSVRDKVGGYLLLSTSADGSMATEARLTSIRVVCANTLGFARAAGKPTVKVSHRSTFDADAVRREMGLNVTAWDAFRRSIIKLGNVATTPREAEALTARIFAGTDDQAAQDKIRDTGRGFAKVLSLFGGEGKGATLDGVFGTRWGLLNAFTEYADHHAPARSAENRFIASQFGPGADLKREAFEVLMA